MADRDPQVALVTVDHTVLEQLVEAATTDASADEVTPALTAGPAWTPSRIAWLRDFHDDRRAGLDGPARGATWAIVVDQRVVGSVRLQRMEQPGMLETGVWLTISARGHGVGRAAMAAALREAAAQGFTSVWAETTSSNVGALTVLERLDAERRCPGVTPLAMQRTTMLRLREHLFRNPFGGDRDQSGRPDVGGRSRTATDAK